MMTVPRADESFTVTEAGRAPSEVFLAHGEFGFGFVAGNRKNGKRRVHVTFGRQSWVPKIRK
jgi:hypothetical protein